MTSPETSSSTLHSTRTMELAMVGFNFLIMGPFQTNSTDRLSNLMLCFISKKRRKDPVRITSLKTSQSKTWHEMLKCIARRSIISTFTKVRASRRLLRTFVPSNPTRIG